MKSNTHKFNVAGAVAQIGVLNVAQLQRIARLVQDGTRAAIENAVVYDAEPGGYLAVAACSADAAEILADVCGVSAGQVKALPLPAFVEFAAAAVHRVLEVNGPALEQLKPALERAGMAMKAVDPRAKASPRVKRVA
jgi:hypothetical protein